jgi:predicted nucleic acid-binding OB-fold protein
MMIIRSGTSTLLTTTTTITIRVVVVVAFVTSVLALAALLMMMKMEINQFTSKTTITEIVRAVVVSDICFLLLFHLHCKSINLRFHLLQAMHTNFCTTNHTDMNLIIH